MGLYGYQMDPYRLPSSFLAISRSVWFAFMTDHFRKRSLCFRDTRDKQEHDTKKLMSIPGPSPEKLMAEIELLKKTDLNNGSYVGVIILSPIIKQKRFCHIRII